MTEPVPYESANFTTLEMEPGLQIKDIPFGFAELALNALEYRIKSAIEPVEGSAIITSTHRVHDALWNLHRKPYPAAIPEYLGLEVLDIGKSTATLATRLYIPSRPRAAQLVLEYSQREYTRHAKKYQGVTRRMTERKIISNPYFKRADATEQGPGVARPAGYITKIVGSPRSRSAD